MELDYVCIAKGNCIQCKSVVLLDTFKPSALKIATSRQTKDKLAKIEQYMHKYCTHGQLHTPKQLNEEINVKHNGIKAKSIAIKANPVRVYGWLYRGTFYASFAVVKKTEKLTPQNAQRIQANFEKFIEGMGL